MGENRQETYDALARYAKRGVIPTDYDKILALVANESDRGTVIILGSLIEDELLRRIFEKSRSDLSETEKNALAKHGGPLGSFENRIKFGHALEVVPPDEVPTLEALKRMRNACAHSREEISFSTPELRNVMALMFGPKTGDAVRKQRDPAVVKHMFVFGVTYILGMLSSGSSEAGFDRVRELSKIVLGKELPPLRNKQNGRRK